MNHGRCGSCGARVLWVEMVSGKKAPLDADPSPRGNIRIIDGVGQVVPKAELADAQAGGLLYLSHFATCATAAQHRKPKG